MAEIQVIITATPVSLPYTGLPIAFTNYSIDIPGLTAIVLYGGSATAPTYPGVYPVEVSIPENETYYGSATSELTITKAPSTITFSEFSAVKSFGDPAFEIVASSTSGFPVTLISENESVLTLSGATAQIVNTGPGLVFITASEGNQYYEADPVSRKLIVVRSGNVITAAAPIGVTTRTIPFNILASASSGLPVSYSLLQGPVSLTEEGQVTVLGAGLVRLLVSQVGSSNYTAASSVEIQFTISPYTQVFQEGVTSYVSTASERTSCPTPIAQDFLLCEPTPGVWPSLQGNLGGLWERVELWWEYVKKTENW